MRLRGALGVLYDIQIKNGILFVYVVGAYVSYIWLCIARAIIPAVSFLTFIWMPESPIYLASKGKKIETEKSLLWLRGARFLSGYLFRKLRENRRPKEHLQGTYQRTLCFL